MYLNVNFSLLLITYWYNIPVPLYYNYLMVPVPVLLISDCTAEGWTLKQTIMCWLKWISPKKLIIKTFWIRKETRLLKMKIWEPPVCSPLAARCRWHSPRAHTSGCREAGRWSASPPPPPSCRRPHPARGWAQRAGTGTAQSQAERGTHRLAWQGIEKKLNNYSFLWTFESTQQCCGY